MMNLQFKEVCPENREEVERLQIFSDQIDFIESVKECLAEADEVSEWKPVGIYDEEKLIGFAMYGFFKTLPKGQIWLDRLLIDKNFQRQGYGRKATLALLQKLHKEYEEDKVYLSVYEDNKAAIALYKQIGFYFNGEYDTKGEKVMVYDYSPRSSEKNRFK